VPADATQIGGALKRRTVGRLPALVEVQPRCRPATGTAPHRQRAVVVDGDLDGTRRAGRFAFAFAFPFTLTLAFAFAFALSFTFALAFAFAFALTFALALAFAFALTFALAFAFAFAFALAFAGVGGGGEERAAARDGDDGRQPHEVQHRATHQRSARTSSTTPW
jgi:hypothetical protein